IAASIQAAMKFFEYLVLQLLIEIDHHIAAQDKIKSTEDVADNQVMIEKGDLAEQVWIKDCMVVLGDVITSEFRCGSSCFVIVLIIERHVFHCQCEEACAQ